MFGSQKSVFIYEGLGPFGEIRYREVARCNPNTANDIARVLREANHQVVVHADRRPPHSY